MEPSTILQQTNELVTVIEQTKLVNYTMIASSAIAVLDWILTFDLEVSLVWQSRWNVTKVLYFLARYLPFVDCTLGLYHQLSVALPIHDCQKLFQVQAWLFGVGAGLVELIYTLRTWAVWGEGKRFTFVLLAIFCGMWTAILVVDHFYLKATSHSMSPVPHLIGCLVTVSSSILSANYILLMLYDACLLSLMVVRGISAFRSGSRLHLVRVVYSDGIIYYVYVWALSLVNVLVITRLPIQLQTLMMLMARVIHAVLSCRVILHIRKQAHVQRQGCSSRQGLSYTSTDLLVSGEFDIT